MRRQFPVALAAALFFSLWYYYSEAHPCITPRPYAVGAVDERFDVDTDTVKRITAEAAMVWEKALGRELFTYDEDASFTVDFIYDERQERTESAEEEKAVLDEKENASKTIGEEYAQLLKEYDTLKKDYEAKVENYNDRLQSFNDTVTSYNQAGGAPQDVYNELQQRERSLKTEEGTLQTESNKLTALAKNLNDLSVRGNNLISEYNEGVLEYNQTYTGGEEFTQGEFHGDTIAIYHFQDQTELKNVLIHEFGHAIGLPHVEGGTSIMYYLMDKQPATSELSKEDLAALGRVCKANDSLSTRFHRTFSSLFIKLHLI